MEQQEKPHLPEAKAMTDKPSIAELLHLESRMERAPWERTSAHVVSNEEYDIGRFDGPSDALGTAALRNAAPVLLEIAAAALAWAGSECETKSCDTDDYTEAAKRNECSGDTHDERCPVDVATRRLASALAKVRP